MAAACCGDERSHPWGDRWPPLYGNFADRAAKPHIPAWVGISNYDDAYVVTCPVTQSGGNEWGIFGLAGNAWEWCEDWLGTGQKHKVRHGGGWSYTTEADTRIATRGMDRPEVKFDTIGFRVVVALKRDR